MPGGPLKPGGDAEILDDRARREYRARLVELQRELDEAERDGDLARTGRAREEMDALVETLSGALGLGGRSRALGSGAERARSAVTWRIRSAIKKIAAAHPSSGTAIWRTASGRARATPPTSPSVPVAWQLSRVRRAPFHCEAMTLRPWGASTEVPDVVPGCPDHRRSTERPSLQSTTQALELYGIYLGKELGLYAAAEAGAR